MHGHLNVKFARWTLRVYLGDGLDCAEDFDATSIRPPVCPARSMSLYGLSYQGRSEFCAFCNILRQWPLSFRRLLILPPRWWVVDFYPGFLSPTEGTELFLLIFCVTFVLCGEGSFDVVFTKFQEQYELVETRYSNTENVRSCPHCLVLVPLHAI